MPRPGKGAITEHMTTTTDPEFEPAVKVKSGTPLVKPHDHFDHLPKAGHWADEDGSNEAWIPNEELINGDVFRCTCNDYFKFFENNISYLYSYDTLYENYESHWARSDRDGNLYRRENLAPKWKRLLFGAEKYEWVLQEPAGE